MILLKYVHTSNTKHVLLVKPKKITAYNNVLIFSLLQTVFLFKNVYYWFTVYFNTASLWWMMNRGICPVLDEVNIIFIFMAFHRCTRHVHVIFNTLVFSAHISFLDFIIFRKI